MGPLSIEPEAVDQMLRRVLAFTALEMALTIAAAGAALQPASVPPAPAPAPSPAPSSSASPPFNRLTFRQIGPAISGGRVTSVAGSARNPSLYVLGTAGGGVWKTVNGGATWAPLFDAQDVSSIGAVTIDPQHDDTLWAGTGETNPRNDVSFGDGIFTSSNGGKTWRSAGLAATQQISAIAVDPHDSATVVVGAMGDFFADSPDRGIYRTTDAGKTWTKTLYVGPSSGVSDLAVDPADPRVMYAGMWQFRRQPWTFSSGGPDDGIFKSVDGGRNWTQLRGHGLPAGITGRIGLAVAPSNPKRVYALIESATGILWRSDDAGANWTLVSHDTLADQRPFYFSHLAVDPANPDHVYGVSESLAESKDGGKTFSETARDVHVDYHAMWIAPNDASRMITGEDGGYALTLDGGKNWSFARNLPIGQIYHIGYDDGTPYRVCVGLQDNNGFCGPSNSLDDEGLADDAWERVVGGDGQWAWPDPTDPNLVWTDLQDGRISIYDRSAQRNTSVAPWIGTAADAFALGRVPYRFNWDSPIAFAPWDGRTAWFGANVVFASTDRGRTWQPISPDLTRDVKAHQGPAGGPLALDVTGAEASDTLLDIEGSAALRGEIWTGSDDGVVELTRDGGLHWRDVTPTEVPPFGRVEMVSPSPLDAATAYAVFDRHMSADRSAYVFVTHDFGAHWASIASGLPAGQEARSIRADTRNPHLVYLGLENSLWLSYDDGTHWQRFNLGLPPAAIYDLRIQPRWNDLIVATHGRSAFIFDDLTAVQQLPQAQSAGAMLFAPRTTYAFTLHANDEGLYTRFAGTNPPSGAIVTFFQAKPGPQPPAIEILDANGRVVRTIAGTRRSNEHEVPLVDNDAGVNRAVWDLREDGPVRWDGAAKDEYKGPRTGAAVVPGRYTVRIRLAGRMFEQPLVVAADPRVRYTAADYAAAYAFAKRHFDEFCALDTTLNSLDAALKAHAADAGFVARARTVRDELTADFHNDEDSLQRPGRVREDLSRLTSGTLGPPPTPAQLDFAARVDAQYARAMRDAAALLGPS
jgi:photosystem II stability/assembly factor-like uncharacterized protein